jgi:hypothetical protein
MARRAPAHLRITVAVAQTRTRCTPPCKMRCQCLQTCPFMAGTEPIGLVTSCCFPTAMSSAPLTSSHSPPSGVLAQSSVHPTPIEFSPSSPVKEKITKQYAAHNRSEVQVFAYDEDIARFFEFLDIPDDHLPSKLPKFNGRVSPDNFVELANAMAKSMKELCECLLL